VPGAAAVLVPLAAHVAFHYLDPRFTLVTTDHVEDYDGPRYMMLMTRKALYTKRIQDVRARLQPIFTIRRQKATLLEIYRLQ
jgi:hypothetical protein